MSKIHAARARSNAVSVGLFARPPSDQALIDAALEGRLDQERLNAAREAHRERMAEMAASTERVRQHLDQCGALPAKVALQKLEARFAKR
jgi:hypothetical protein